ncbi:PEP-CTERM sorting domain-containing protein [uncultured Roseobacter sp.]|uniref:PEP-CTERM sorting domain-containing protein n=1 Tax=uncultured Roseobacter sp. TaxID=114847 RepID=UPI002627F2F7|nr:PEP-CTERM sorting domain-containing protein [uncultured Roseobacter sp.]
MKYLITALLCAFTTLPAQAATVTLDLTSNAPAFADRSVDSGDTVSAVPFSLTVQSVQTLDNSPAFSLSSGLMLGRSIGFIVSLDLVFNIDTVIDTYGVSSASQGGGSFQISGSNGTSGLNAFQTPGTNVFEMGTIPVFLAGQTYTLTHDASVAFLNAFGLSSPPPVAPVPVPASLPLLLAGFGTVALLRRRARRRI